MALTKHALRFDSTVGNCDEVKSFLYTGDGTQLTQTGGALDVNIASGSLSIQADLDGVFNGATNTDPDNVGVIHHSRAASIGDAQQIERTTAAVPASSVAAAAFANANAQDVNSFGLWFDGTDFQSPNIDATTRDVQVDVTNDVTVTATDLDIRDLSAAQDNVAISDGTDTLAINADGSINTNLAGSAFVDDRLKVVDCFDSIAVSSPVLAAATATDVTAVANQTFLEIQNEGNQPVYLGPSGTVTAATGICIPCGGTWSGKACGTVALISTPGTAAGDVRIAQYAV